MKIKILIICSILIILCITFLAVKTIIKNHESPKELVLTYKINAGIPFKWEYEIADKSVVAFVKSYVKEDQNKGGIVGAPVYTNYVFKGLKEGKTTITFKYVNITDKSVSQEETHDVIVDKDKNIFVVDYDK